MEKSSKVFVAGHRGMVGSAIVRKLKNEGFNNIISRTTAELDLRNQAAVRDFFDVENPEYVFMAAAKVGGIMANDTYRAEFLYDNLMIETNVIHQSYTSNVKKLLFLGSSCIYPKFAPQPMKEEYLLTGTLEPTNEPYAIAKIVGIKLCETYRDQYGCNFISVMPTNLYGQNDNYDLQNSHVLPAMIRKFHEAKTEGKPFVELWGSGTPRREFLHVDDLADASFYIMQHYNDKGFVNIGVGEDITIKDLALLIKSIVGYEGDLHWDSSKPDGTPQKLLNIDRLKTLGFVPKISLEEGISAVYQDFRNKIAEK